MHTRLFSSGLPWSQKLEGAYIPKNDLRRYHPEQDPVPWLGEDGHFALERLGSDWIIQRWVLREKGIIVCGPPLTPMIDPVSAEDLQNAVRSSLHEWWSPPALSPQRFNDSEYRAYAVLTMCRSLYVLKYGKIVSKPFAAQWAIETLGEPWDGLIQAAKNWVGEKEFDRLDETMEFIQYTLDQCQLMKDGRK